MAAGAIVLLEEQEEEGMRNEDRKEAIVGTSLKGLELEWEEMEWWVSFIEEINKERRDKSQVTKQNPNFYVGGKEIKLSHRK